MPRKAFVSKINPALLADPVIADIGGTLLSGEGEWSRSFQCLPIIPAGAMDDLSNMVYVDQRTGKQMYNAPSLIGFMKQVIVPEQVDEFVELMHSTEFLVDLAELGACMEWVVEELMSRPTQP